MAALTTMAATTPPEETQADAAAEACAAERLLEGTLQAPRPGPLRRLAPAALTVTALLGALAAVVLHSGQPATLSRRVPGTGRFNTLSQKRHKESDHKCGEAFDQCGGIGFRGTTCCQSGCVCAETDNKYYMQCEPPTANGSQCDATEAKHARGVWTNMREVAKKDAQYAKKEHSKLRALRADQADLVELLKEEVKAAVRVMGQKEEAAVEAKKKSVAPPEHEDWCAKEFQSCGTPGNPVCCQRGCHCEGDESSKTCMPKDASGTCLEATRNELLEFFAQKEAERDEAKKKGKTSAQALKAARSRLKELTKEFEESEASLAAKEQGAKAAVRNLALWRDVKAPGVKIAHEKAAHRQDHAKTDVAVITERSLEDDVEGSAVNGAGDNQQAEARQTMDMDNLEDDDVKAAYRQDHAKNDVDVITEHSTEDDAAGSAVDGAGDSRQVEARQMMDIVMDDLEDDGWKYDGWEDNDW